MAGKKVLVVEDEAVQLTSALAVSSQRATKWSALATEPAPSARRAKSFPISCFSILASPRVTASLS